MVAVDGGRFRPPLCAGWTQLANPFWTPTVFDDFVERVRLLLRRNDIPQVVVDAFAFAIFANIVVVDVFPFVDDTFRVVVDIPKGMNCRPNCIPR
jgi:hypothetical protein